MNVSITLELYIYFALAISVIGLAYKLGLYLWSRLTMPSEMTPRTQTPYLPQRRSWIKAIWMTNIETFTRFWWRSNPVMLVGHVAYHVGLFTAVGTYAFVTVFALDRIPGTSLAEKTIGICEWFTKPEVIFNQEGLLSPVLGYWLKSMFIAALVLACIGIAIPYIMTLLHRRGVVRPVDHVMTAAGIRRLVGLPTRHSVLGYQRKILGLIVLVMDWAMLSTFVFPSAVTYGLWVHVIFTFTIVALFPFSFFSHELYRFRMWTAVRRLHDGRTA